MSTNGKHYKKLLSQACVLIHKTSTKDDSALPFKLKYLDPL